MQCLEEGTQKLEEGDVQAAKVRSASHPGYMRTERLTSVSGLGTVHCADAFVSYTQTVEVCASQSAAKLRARCYKELVSLFLPSFLSSARREHSCDHDFTSETLFL